MKIKNAFQAVVLLALLLVMLILPAYVIASDENVTQQLDALIQALEDKRIEHHIPGMAIAVVKDDQVILSHSFGHMNLDKKIPVNNQTLFAIGSTTKAFTATLVGMLVEQDKMNWDDQVSQFLPSYQFKHEAEYLPITLRDMLSHRTGYTRNDVLWANGLASRELILKTATQAAPWDDYKSHFHYNNVMYLAAGEATAKQAGLGWDQLLEERIFEPLGMQQTTTQYQVAVADPNVSLGYLWNEETQGYEVLPRRNTNNIAPAGGIYSNVEDMAQWVRLQLNQGQFNQQQLISQEVLAQTHQPQINISDNVSYGLGWFLQKWQGQAVIEHGGSIDGYAAQVALLPESNLGFVLLANVSATPLQQASMNLVWEHLAQPVKATHETADTAADKITSYTEYVGEYHANFGSFNDEIFTFKIKDNGKPAVDVPGQTLYELKQPDAEGHWYFAMTDTVAVSFDRDQSGQVTAMRMHQNRMDFELPKKGVPITAEIDASELQTYLGQYRSGVFKGNIDVVIQNHRLTLDVPNQMAFELHLPDDDGFRQFRIKDDMSAKFERDDSGQINQLVLYRDQVKVVETAPKIKGNNAKPLPTVADIMAMRKPKQRLKALSDGADFKLIGSIKLIHSGIEGKVTTQFDADKRFKQHIDFGPFGEIVNVVNEDSAAEWGIIPYRQFQGNYLTQIRREHPAVDVDWRDYYDQIEVVNERFVDGKLAYELRLEKAGIPAVRLTVDASNGDVLQQDAKILNPKVGSIKVKIKYHDYQLHHGLRVPFKITIYNPMNGRTEIEYQTLMQQQNFVEQTFSTHQPH